MNLFLLILRLVRKELPSSYLEEYAGASSKTSKFPPEVLCMMRAIRVFGHLEEPVFLELCRRMVTLEVDTNQLLFQPGDADDSVYMVQKGENVFLRAKADYYNWLFFPAIIHAHRIQRIDWLICLFFHSAYCFYTFLVFFLSCFHDVDSIIQY